MLRNIISFVGASQGRRPRSSARAGRARARSQASCSRSTGPHVGTRCSSMGYRLGVAAARLIIALARRGGTAGQLSSSMAPSPRTSPTRDRRRPRTEIREVSRIAHIATSSSPSFDERLRHRRGRARRQAELAVRRQRIAIARAILADPRKCSSSTKRRRASTAKANR